MCPSGAVSRYLIANIPSAYFVARPKRPAMKSQNNAPGPPRQIAVATPTILPVPIVADNAVHNAPKEETLPVAPSSLVNIHLSARLSLLI